MERRTSFDPMERITVLEAETDELKAKVDRPGRDGQPISDMERQLLHQRIVANDEKLKVLYTLLSQTLQQEKSLPPASSSSSRPEPPARRPPPLTESKEASRKPKSERVSATGNAGAPDGLDPYIPKVSGVGGLLGRRTADGTSTPPPTPPSPQPEKSPGQATASAKPSQGLFGGDHIRIEIYAVRAATPADCRGATPPRLLDASRHHYVKVFLCDYHGADDIKPWEKSIFRTAELPVPQVPETPGSGVAGKSFGSALDATSTTPTMGSSPCDPASPGSATLISFRTGDRSVDDSVGEELQTSGTVAQIRTNFQYDDSDNTTFIALELKEVHSFGDNAVVATTVLPLKGFLNYTADTVREEWFPMYRLKAVRKGSEGAHLPVAFIHAAFSVPGGVPKQLRPAYHVAGADMSSRQLIVTITSASIRASSDMSTVDGSAKHYFETAPRSYVSVTTLHTGKADPSVLVPGKKVKTAIEPPSFAPRFASRFIFSEEMANCKLLLIKFKALEEGVLTTSNVPIGEVKIPVQFYLTSQEIGAPVEQDFPVYGPDLGTAASPRSASVTGTPPPQDLQGSIPSVSTKQVVRGTLHIRLEVAAMEGYGEFVDVAKDPNFVGGTGGGYVVG